MSIFQSPTVTVNRDTDGSYVLVIDVPGKAVNVINQQVMTDLDSALNAIAAQPRVPVLVIRSGKKSGFLAGADLNEFVAITDAAGARAISERGQALFARLASVNAPTIAVIHGPCLGGGLELALACDFRLVFDRANTQLGLPEVELGLLPAWGGTQRLPRVVGLEKSLQMILGGKRLDAKEAFNWHLADAYAADENGLRDQFTRLLMRAISEGKRERERLPLRGWRQRLLESNVLGRRIILRGAERILRHKVPDDMPAPIEAFDAIRTGLDRGMQAGFTHEREAAGRLATSRACRNLISIFFQREAARKSPGEDVPPIKSLGVVGAGVMGAGIAQLAALSGCAVVVQEVNQAALQAGKARIDELFNAAVKKGRYSVLEAQQKKAAIRYSLNWEGFDDVDLVIEAALEDMEVKRNLFKDLDKRTSPTTILATNTSSLTVSRLLDGMTHPERVAGLHFFNPVHKMPLVEVVRTPATSQGCIDQLVRFSIDLGKTPAVVGDRPGFVVNRVLMPYLNETLGLVGEGLKVKEIDRAMRKFGMPMGPLELLDQIGLDVAAHVGRLVQEQMGEKHAAHAGFEAMRQKGWLGTKCGLGFYHHGKHRTRVHKAAEELLRSTAASSGLAMVVKLPEAVRLAEARERLVLLMVNESAQALSEGLADAATIDLAMVFGTGWAPHRGGPLRYADDRGLGEVVRALEGLAARLGPRFLPCAELKRRAEAGWSVTQK